MRTAVITLNGKQVGFIARESGSTECVGCLFDKCRSNICVLAGTNAFLAGQPDCEDRAPNGGNYIYVEADPRQLVIDDIKETTA